MTDIIKFIANAVLKPETIEERIAHEALELVVYGEIWHSIKKALE